MRLDAGMSIAVDFEVLDRSTGNFIEHCLWADQNTGRYEVYCPETKLSEIRRGWIVLVYLGE